MSTELVGRILALALPPQEAFLLTKTVHVKDTLIDNRVAEFHNTPVSKAVAAHEVALKDS